MNELSERPVSEIVWFPTLDTAWPFDRWFQRAWNDDWGAIARSSFWTPGAFRFRSEVFDRGGAHEIVAELPGIPKDQIHVTLQGPKLRIRAETPSPKGRGTEAGTTPSASTTVFERTVEFAEPVPAASIQAKVENGILTVTVPKPAPLPEETIALA